MSKLDKMPWKTIIQQTGIPTSERQIYYIFSDFKVADEYAFRFCI